MQIHTPSNVRCHPIFIATTGLAIGIRCFLGLRERSASFPLKPRDSTDLVEEGHEFLGVLVGVGVVDSSRSSEAWHCS